MIIGLVTPAYFYVVSLLTTIYVDEKSVRFIFSVSYFRNSQGQFPFSPLEMMSSYGEFGSSLLSTALDSSSVLL